MVAAAGLGALLILSSTQFALPALAGDADQGYFAAFAQKAGGAHKKGSSKGKDIVSHRMHRHKKLRVPTSANLARYATSSSKARYYYVCSCGKKFKATYTHGYPRTISTYRLKERYRDNPKGGIAFTGSSQFSRWDSLASDLANAYNYPSNKVYNLARGGRGVNEWVKPRYINAIVRLKPSVVVVAGINELRDKSVMDHRSDGQAARGSVRLLKRYIGILKNRLPHVKIIIVGGIKTPADYSKGVVVDGTPVNWTRIDAYNKAVRRLASHRRSVRFIDIQGFFMADVKLADGAKTLGFYCGGKNFKSLSQIKSVEQIVNAKRNHNRYLCPYFIDDLRHPSALAYAKVWLPTVGKAAVSSANKASKSAKLGKVHKAGGKGKAHRASGNSKVRKALKAAKAL